MIDYYKLLEVNKNTKVSDIKKNYKRKVDLLRYDSVYDMAIKFKIYNIALATLIHQESKMIYDASLESQYIHSENTVPITEPFSRDEEINKKIITKIESSIIECLLTHKDSALEQAYLKFIHELNAKEVNSIRKLDCQFHLADSNLYPYFEANYHFFHKQEKENIKRR